MISRLILPASLFCAMFMVACEDGHQTDTKAVIEPVEQRIADSLKSLSEMEPSLLLADSLQILYYDDPEGDSLRYSRYFRYTISADSVVTNTMKNEFLQRPEIRNTLRNCRAEGKIYVFGNGKELKTVYFSTRPDACGFLYIIRNGNFYYVNLQEQFKNILHKERAKSVKP